MTKIYLIRHAEAEGNLYRRIQGHYDGDITGRGYKQIEMLAERFRGTKIDAVYASDLKRTQKTAAAILKHHDLKLNIEPRLKEVNMGVWEDRPWGNVSYEEPEQMLLFSSDPSKWNIEGNESFEDLKARITGIICELAERHDGQTVACFSHGMAIRTLISGIKGISSENIHEILHGDNTCVSLLYYQDGELKIDYYNDNSHLPEELSTFAGQSWWKNKDKVDFSNLRLIPMDINEDGELYSSCYRDGWQEAHGTSTGYEDEPYLRKAIKVSKENPFSLMKAFYGDEFAGIIELDPERMASEGAGWISLCYLVPKLRGHNMGVQLIGHAVSVYRELGRKSTRLHVSQTNVRAISFYEKFDFKRISVEKGKVCPLELMEKQL